MKVGTDGVLLGSWCCVDVCNTILDIGTGTGLIALMAAQRNRNAHVTALEIDESAAYQARENVMASPFVLQVEVVNKSAQQFSETCSEKFDLLVCNPPYFIDSLKCPDKGRTTARHSDMLSHEDLIGVALKLLKQDGKLEVILPTLEGNQFIEKALTKGLFLQRKTDILPTLTAKVKRVLLSFGFAEQAIEQDELVIELSRHVYSEKYKLLTKDFYLKF